MASEVRWSCGCHEVDGKLEVECTQSQHQGEMSAERHATARPFSAKCFRLAAEVPPTAEPTSEPEPPTE